MTNVLSIKTGDILDLINTAQYLNEALHMAASDSGLTRPATNALQALSGEIDNKLRIIEDRLNEVREQIADQEKTLLAIGRHSDAAAILAAVQSEQARRKNAEEDAA